MAEYGRGRQAPISAPPVTSVPGSSTCLSHLVGERGQTLRILDVWFVAWALRPQDERLCIVL